MGLLRMGASCLLGASCLVPFAAFAQQAAVQDEVLDPASADALEEIVVTAQKREDSLQNTPISIAVLSGEDLAARGITSFAGFGEGAVPSLRIASANGRPSAFTVTMRGVNPGGSAEISRDPTVGLYVDGVYLGRTQGLGVELMDVQRLEVLRGPQGTLFGRNAVAGAISIVSKRPTGELGLDLTAGTGNYGELKARAHLNLPKIAGFSVKLDGTWARRDGWVDNPLAGQSDWYAYNRRGGRVSVLWEPTEDVNVLYSYDTSRDATAAGYGHMARQLPGAAPLPPLFGLETSRVERGRVGVPLIPSIGKVSGHSLNAEWSISPELTARSISAYRKLSQTQFDSPGSLTLPFSPNGVFNRLSYANVHQDQFSQELQLLGSYEHLKFVLGAFYYEEDADDLAYSSFLAQFNATGTDYRILPVVLGGPTFPDRASVVHAKSAAVFGEATYTPPLLDERLHLTAGLRWTHDRKQGALTRARGAVINTPFRFNSKRVDPAFTMAFDWTDNINTYLKWGRAYRAGGAASRSTTFRAFDEELVSTWEVGFKSELFDRRARLNIAAYSTRYTDRQVDFVNPRNLSSAETLNAPGATKIKGVEVDLTARVAAGLTLTGSYAFTDWETPIDINPFSGLPQQGVIVFTPRHSASLALDHEMPVTGAVTLSTHLDAVYSSSTFTGGGNQPQTGPYAILNGRVTLGGFELSERSAKLSFSLWGKNLANKQWETFQFNIAGPTLANFTSVFWNEPRTYGLEARISF